MAEVVRGMSGEGFTMNRNSIASYVSGRYPVARTTYLCAFAAFFGYSVPDLLGRDLKQEDEVAAELEAMKKAK